MSAVAAMTVGMPQAGLAQGDPGPPGAPHAWTLSSDFALHPNQANPNPDSFGNDDVWYFMGSSTLVHDPATYVLLSDFVTDALCVPGIQQWHDPLQCPGPCLGCLPTVGINATGLFQRVMGIRWPANTVRLHPMPSQLAIVGWRSPVGGTVAVEGRFADMDLNCGDGVDWSMDHGALSLAEGSITQGGSQLFSLPEITLNQGEFLYFIVGPRNNFGCDSTALELTITLSEPGCDSAVGEPYCFGNEVLCPCGNGPFPCAGCANSTGQGVTLTALGSASIALDDLVMTAASVPPNQFGIFFMGSATSTVPFGSGLRCVGSGGTGFFRFPIQFSGPLGSMSMGPGVVDLSHAGFPPAGRIVSGDTWYFQAWYRDPSGPCGGATNFSNGLAVQFTP
ncbi:MAG: hypothetical protein GY711_10465 [bacterium]|nr:hypothetical protein [bacterium]